MLAGRKCTKKEGGAFPILRCKSHDGRTEGKESLIQMPRNHAHEGKYQRKKNATHATHFWVLPKKVWRS